MRLSGTVTELWRLKDNGVTSLTFSGHVKSSVTSRDHSTPWGRLPMSGPWWPCVYLAPLWRYGPLKFFQKGSSKNRGWSSVVGHRSVLNITLISYTPFRYVRNVAREK